MREVVQFLSDSEVYFDFSTRLLHLEDGTSVSLHDYQSDLLHLFVSNPNTVIPTRQIVAPEFKDIQRPDSYYENHSVLGEAREALFYIQELWKYHFILETVIQTKSRFEYVYIGNELMVVEDDWAPNLPNIVTTDIHESNVDQAISVVDATDNAFPYEGDEPFVFVSYAHKNSKEVMDILSRLNGYGLRIWYDEGIEWGSEWPQSIAEHLKKCSIFLAFHSEESIVSPNCRQEVAYAIKNNKTILAVYLENVELPDGMDMQLSLYQAIHKKGDEATDALAGRLIKNKMLQPCIEPIKIVTVEKHDPPIENVSPSESTDTNYAILKFYPIIMLGSVLGTISGIFILEYISAINLSNLMITITSVVIFFVSYFIGSAVASASLENQPTNSKSINNWMGMLPYTFAILFSLIVPPLASLVIDLLSAFLFLCFVTLFFVLIFTLIFRLGGK